MYVRDVADHLSWGFLVITMPNRLHDSGTVASKTWRLRTLLNEPNARPAAAALRRWRRAASGTAVDPGR